MKERAKIQKKIILTKKNYKIMKTTFKLYYKFKGNKRFTFEREFGLQTIAAFYAQNDMKDKILSNLIEEYKIVKCKK